MTGRADAALPAARRLREAWCDADRTPESLELSLAPGRAPARVGLTARVLRAIPCWGGALATLKPFSVRAGAGLRTDRACLRDWAARRRPGTAARSFPCSCLRRLNALRLRTGAPCAWLPITGTSTSALGAAPPRAGCSCRVATEVGPPTLPPNLCVAHNPRGLVLPFEHHRMGHSQRPFWSPDRPGSGSIGRAAATGAIPARRGRPPRLHRR